MPSDVTARIQECHVAAIHVLCELVEESYPEPGVLTEGTPDAAQRQALFVDAILAKVQAEPLARAASG